MSSTVSSEFEEQSVQDLVIEKLEALVKLAKAGKIVKGKELLAYDPDGKGRFIPREYTVSFEVIDPDTNLPVTVSMSTPIVKEKKND